MTPAQLKAARIGLGLSRDQLAAELGLSAEHGNRTIRRWENSEVTIPGPIEIVMHYWMKDAKARRVRWAFVA